MRTVKKRKPRGTKLDGTRSMDMCPHCISFGCDPMAMSRKFQDKITKRRRMKLCPACGQPEGFCRCGSSLSKENTGRTLAHDNRKLRRAWNKVHVLELAYREWSRHADAIMDLLGEDTASAIGFALYYHEMPPVPWNAVRGAVLESGADPETVAMAWNAG